VSALELGELAGERGDDVAGLARAGVTGLDRAGRRLGAQLLDALPEGGVAVEEVQRYGGGGGQAAEGDRLQVERAYDLGPLYARGYDGRGRTIVIVDPFGSPAIRRDLGVFDRAFGLPAPPSLRILRPAGQVPRLA
jgi:hypothetical protein